MLESLIFKPASTVYAGQAPIASPAVNPRAAMAVGKYGSTIMYTGGQAAAADPYPTYGWSVKLNTAQTGVDSNTQISGYDGTWNSGTVIGDKLWVAMGHDGNFNNYLRSRTFPTGAVSLDRSALAPGVGRIRCLCVAIDSDRILWGLGVSSTGPMDDSYIYKISTNTWTRAADCNVPVEFKAYGASGGTFINGKVYVWTANNRLAVYDVAPNTWSLAPSWKHLYPDSTSYSDMATCAAGKYLLMFVNGGRSGTAGKLTCIRYDTVFYRYDLFEWPALPARYYARALYDSSLTRVYLVSGSTVQTAGATSWDTSVKFNNMLIFDAQQFLI